MVYNTAPVSGFRIIKLSNLRCSGGGNSGLTLKDDDTISKVSSHDEIVLDDERGFLRVEDESGEKVSLVFPPMNYIYTV